MTKSVSLSAVGAIALGALGLLLFVVPAVAILVLPEGSGKTVVAWGLVIYATLVIAGMGLLRLFTAWRAGGQSRSMLVLAAAPPLCAIAAAVFASMIGFRWTLAILIGALAVQGVWDLSGDALPQLLKRIRPPVSVGALMALLLAFMGS